MVLIFLDFLCAKSELIPHKLTEGQQNKKKKSVHSIPTLLQKGHFSSHYSVFEKPGEENNWRFLL